MPALPSDAQLASIRAAWTTAQPASADCVASSQQAASNSFTEASQQPKVRKLGIAWLVLFALYALIQVGIELWSICTSFDFSDGFALASLMTIAAHLTVRSALLVVMCPIAAVYIYAVRAANTSNLETLQSYELANTSCTN